MKPRSRPGPFASGLKRLLSAAWFVLSAAATYGAGHNWQASANGTLPLSRFSIPGTHDSGALYEPIGGTAKCQDLSIADQLNAGVRFLDIRCRHVNDAFAIHHGSVYQNQNFGDVLNAVVGFLNSNPTECVIMSVKEEHDPSGNTRSFEATFDSYVAQNPGRWLLTSGIPTLNAARGRIVLVRRFNASSLPKGIPATSWADNTTFTSGSLRVQDFYNVPDPGAKWTAVTQLFDEALAGGPDTLYLNFTSGYKSGLFGIPSITTVSDVINPNLTSYFSSPRSGRFGVIIMDFANAARCAMIYQVQDLSLTLGSSVNPSFLGESVTFTVTLVGTGPTPTGTVTFKDGASTLASVSLSPTGIATFTTTNLPTGNRSIAAVYNGDAVYVSKTSSALTQTVNIRGPNIWTGAAGNVWNINTTAN